MTACFAELQARLAGQPTAAIPSSGQSFPLGATVLSNGINFSVFSTHASRVELLLFDDAGEQRPTRAINLGARKHRTYHYWHVFVPGIRSGQLYGYRVTGPFAPEHGLRFDPSKVLLDPYGRAVAVPDGYSRQMASQYGVNDAIAMKSVVVDSSSYDWEGDVPLRRPIARTIIYEMHVAGFTRHPSSGVAQELRGTYAGMIEKIPYLQDLGITAVELLPIFQFDGRLVRPGWSITGGIRRSRSSLLMPATVRAGMRSDRSTSSVISSRRCTAPASR